MDSKIKGDQRLTEVTFGVTINVLRLTEVTFKSNDAQLWKPDPFFKTF